MLLQTEVEKSECSMEAHDERAAHLGGIMDHSKQVAGVLRLLALCQVLRGGWEVAAKAGRKNELSTEASSAWAPHLDLPCRQIQPGESLSSRNGC